MRIFAIAVLVTVLVASATGQSGGGLVVTQGLIAGGGGGPSAGGNFSVTGTVGQPVAGGNASGGSFAVSAGFWSNPLAPTAATVTVAGRVVDFGGHPLRNVVVSMTDAAGAVTVTRTNAFGYFTFYEVQSGQTYLVDIAARSHTFATQVLTVRDAIAALEFRSLDQ